MPINSRKKGHGFELDIVKRFKEVGFADAMTTRLGSKFLDAQKIDIMNIGNIAAQCKAVERMNAHKVFAEIPSDNGMVPVLFHKKNRQGTLAVISADQYFEWLKLLLDNGLIKP